MTSSLSKAADDGDQSPKPEPQCPHSAPDRERFPTAFVDAATFPGGGLMW